MCLSACDNQCYLYRAVPVPIPYSVSSVNISFVKCKSLMHCTIITSCLITSLIPHQYTKFVIKPIQHFKSVTQNKFYAENTVHHIYYLYSMISDISFQVSNVMSLELLLLSHNRVFTLKSILTFLTVQ